MQSGASKSGIRDSHPQLISEWHPTKNSGVDLSTVTAGLNKKFWWLCTKGHEWQAVVSSRARGATCPYCSGVYPWQGETDLATTHPDLAKDWHPTKNGDLLPSQVLAGYSSKVWWRCKNGHDWEIAPANRKLGSGCPYCAGTKTWAGFNDLQTLYPSVAAEWHPTLNGLLQPSQVTGKSNKSVFWMCPIDNRHYWKDSVNHRTSMGRNCAVCRGYQVIPGVNDLASAYPHLAHEWHPSKNGSRTPETVTLASNFKVWWKCSNGHEWEAKVSHRMNGSDCPFCSGRFAVEGETDLATTHPQLAKEWDSDKNKLEVTQVKAFSAQKAWWICAKKHSWAAAVSSRSAGAGCPFCSGLLPIPGETDLATLRPNLVAEWHPSKNGKLIPRDCTVGTPKKVWWICSEGHEWKTAVVSRSNGTGCPRCAVYGYDSSKAGILYFIENELLRARKIGITNLETKASRLKDFSTLGWGEVCVIQDEDGLLVRNVESQVLSWIRKDLGLPPYLSKAEMGRHGGHSETFSIEGPSNQEVIRKIQSSFQDLRG